MDNPVTTSRGRSRVGVLLLQLLLLLLLLQLLLLLLLLLLLQIVICSGLMGMVLSFQARVPRFKSPLDPQAIRPGSYINVRHCGGLYIVLMQQKHPSGLFVKRREFLPGSGFLSLYEMTKAVDSDIKTHSFLPYPAFSFLFIVNPFLPFYTSSCCCKNYFYDY